MTSSGSPYGSPSPGRQVREGSPGDFNALFPKDFPLKYCRVSFTTADGTALATVVPFDGASTSTSVVRDVVNNFARRNGLTRLRAEALCLAYRFQGTDGKLYLEWADERVPLCKIPFVAYVLEMREELLFFLMPKPTAVEIGVQPGTAAAVGALGSGGDVESPVRPRQPLPDIAVTSPNPHIARNGDGEGIVSPNAFIRSTARPPMVVEMGTQPMAVPVISEAVQTLPDTATPAATVEQIEARQRIRFLQKQLKQAEETAERQRILTSLVAASPSRDLQTSLQSLPPAVNDVSTTKPFAGRIRFIDDDEEEERAASIHAQELRGSQTAETVPAIAIEEVSSVNSEVRDRNQYEDSAISSSVGESQRIDDSSIQRYRKRFEPNVVRVHPLLPAALTSLDATL